MRRFDWFGQSSFAAAGAASLARGWRQRVGQRLASVSAVASPALATPPPLVKEKDPRAKTKDTGAKARAGSTGSNSSSSNSSGGQPGGGATAAAGGAFFGGEDRHNTQTILHSVHGWEWVDIYQTPGSPAGAAAAAAAAAAASADGSDGGARRDDDAAAAVGHRIFRRATGSDTAFLLDLRRLLGDAGVPPRLVKEATRRTLLPQVMVMGAQEGQQEQQQQRQQQRQQQQQQQAALADAAAHTAVAARRARAAARAAAKAAAKSGATPDPTGATAPSATTAATAGTATAAAASPTTSGSDADDRDDADAAMSDAVIAEERRAAFDKFIASVLDAEGEAQAQPQDGEADAASCHSSSGDDGTPPLTPPAAFPPQQPPQQQPQAHGGGFACLVLRHTAERARGGPVVPPPSAYTAKDLDKLELLRPPVAARYAERELRRATPLRGGAKEGFGAAAGSAAGGAATGATVGRSGSGGNASGGSGVGRGRPPAQPPLAALWASIVLLFTAVRRRLASAVAATGAARVGEATAGAARWLLARGSVWRHGADATSAAAAALATTTQPLGFSAGSAFASFGAPSTVGAPQNESIQLLTTRLTVFLFPGNRRLLTVHRLPLPVLRKAQLHWTSDYRHFRLQDFLALIVRECVLSFAHSARCEAAALDGLERALFASRLAASARRGAGAGAVERLFSVNRRATVFCRVLLPLPECYVELLEAQFGSPRDRVGVQDVVHGVRNSLALCEELRATSASLLTLHFQMSGNELEEFARVMAAINTSITPVAFVAGIFGTNFVAWEQLFESYEACMFVMLLLVLTAAFTRVWFRMKVTLRR